MSDLTRRHFAGMSLGGLAAIGFPTNIYAAPQCAAPPRQSYLPNLLLISCAARQNLKLFRQYSDYLGLAGVVSMTETQGARGTYRAGTLILYPWLKPKGRKLSFTAALPTGLSSATNGKPIPGAALPQDEYLCRFLLQAPWQAFIGFTVDTPMSFEDTMSGWCSNIPKLADGQGVGVDWTSSNLNRGWFGGSTCITKDDACQGAAWRALIADGLSQASTGAC